MGSILARLSTMGWQGLEHIESLTTDYEKDYVEVRTVDGRVLREVREPSSVEDSVPIDYKRVTWRPADLLMTMVTAWDEELEVEVFGNDDQLARRKGRPVVYLDQNIWVQISKAIYRPDSMPDPEVAPTLQLVERARHEEVILPISSAHWIETGPTYGQRRTQLAALMVGLSRGWIMRDPLLVAAAEMRALFVRPPGGSPPQVESVFTLDHQHLFGEWSSPYVSQDPDLPEELLRLIEALSGVNATLSVLLESERTEPEGVAAAMNWAAVHQDFGRYVVGKRRSSSDLRRFTLDAFLENLGHGLMDAADAAGLGTSDLQAWAQSRADEDLAQLPYLGRERELIHLRLLNTGDTWEPNDLVDVLYLSCAAGYADYVVCEKKTGDYLQRVSRNRPGGASVVTSIRELLAALEL